VRREHTHPLHTKGVRHPPFTSRLNCRCSAGVSRSRRCQNGSCRRVRHPPGRVTDETDYFRLADNAPYKPVYEDLFPDSEHKTRSMSDLPLLSSIENQREIMFDGYNTPHSLIPRVSMKEIPCSSALFSCYWLPG